MYEEGMMIFNLDIVTRKILFIMHKNIVTIHV